VEHLGVRAQGGDGGGGGGFTRASRTRTRVRCGAGKRLPTGGTLAPERERERAGRGWRSGVPMSRGSGPCARGGRKEEEEKRAAHGEAGPGCQGKRKEGGGGKMAGWAGPKGEKREGGKKKEEEQILLNLNMKIEFKLKSK
jgi:hypothetical protein